MTKTLPGWPSLLNSIWAKSLDANSERGESLPEHTWEVLSRLRDLARMRPWLSENYSLPLWSILFWAAFLHDWVKAAQGFQKMLREGKRTPHRHEVLSLAFLDWISPGFSEEQAIAIAAAIVSHHRDPNELLQLYPLSIPPEDDPSVDLIREVDETTMHALYQWIKEVAPGWIRELSFDELGVNEVELVSEEHAIDQVTQNGALGIRKWLRRYHRFVRELQEDRHSDRVFTGIFLRGLVLIADHVASAHAGPLPILSCEPKAILSANRFQEKDLYKHQQQALKTLGSSILIAPTGSGKTESALLWASQQSKQQPGVRKVFYVLPYQASMNAMFDRLVSYFPDQVGLLHGRSLLALYQRYMETDYGPGEAARQAMRSRNLAKLHYYPIQVCSPYQLLKSVYRLKGYEALLTNCVGAAFILDEIHAYEPARLAMILEFVRYLYNHFNAHFFIMSATMPTVIRDHVDEVLGHPSVTYASKQLFQSFMRHQVHLLHGDLLSEEGVERIKAAFKQGHSILVVCNTVNRAQEAYDRLCGDLSAKDIILVHGRFNGRDRIEKEHKVMAATGLNSKERKPVVVVATQVVEVSLNIDLDMLFSDPAPLEALMQRLGRVNRNRRVELAPAYIFNEPADGQGIYLPALVQGAIEALNRYAVNRPVDEGSVQSWLDEIYTDSVLDEWQGKYIQMAEEFRTVFLQSLRPFSNEDNLAELFDRLFDGKEVLPHSLLEEYEVLQERDPLEAPHLLVPISWGRWMQIKNAGLVRTDYKWPPVVDVPYSQETGLMFDLITSPHLAGDK
ncbi:MAG: CRISPR-associated helicase Cas3' [Actinobacteria bacterium]|nr:CRISPR-associated helicase Cas3' [Actinomycetota bacterium]